MSDFNQSILNPADIKPPDIERFIINIKES